MKGRASDRMRAITSGLTGSLWLIGLFRAFGAVYLAVGTADDNASTRPLGEEPRDRRAQRIYARAGARRCGDEVGKGRRAFAHRCFHGFAAQCEFSLADLV